MACYRPLLEASWRSMAAWMSAASTQPLSCIGPILKYRKTMEYERRSMEVQVHPRKGNSLVDVPCFPSAIRNPALPDSFAFVRRSARYVLRTHPKSGVCFPALLIIAPCYRINLREQGYLPITDSEIARR